MSVRMIIFFAGGTALNTQIQVWDPHAGKVMKSLNPADGGAGSCSPVLWGPGGLVVAGFADGAVSTTQALSNPLPPHTHTHNEPLLLLMDVPWLVVAHTHTLFPMPLSLLNAGAFSFAVRLI